MVGRYIKCCTDQQDWGDQSSVAKYKDYPSDYVLMDPADLAGKKCEILEI